MSSTSATESRGLHISFLGIDGIGKSTLAQHLTAELRARGLTVTPVSWRSCLDAELPVWPQEALRTMWMDTFRLLFGGAVHQGRPVSLPERYADWTSQQSEERLGELQAAASSPSGPLAAALVEFAGNLVLHSEVIRPALERGETVVQETFPYKHVLKEYLLASELADGADAGSYTPGDVDFLFSPIEEFFGGGALRPDLGILVDGPVELALQRRLAQSGAVGVLEDLRTVGRHGNEGFIALQSASAQRFRAFARKFDWSVITVEDAPVEVNTRRGLDLLLSRIARARPSWDLEQPGDGAEAAHIDMVPAERLAQ
ncbi:dTMP kinase [Streptomyces sp. NPDC012510]|uniref:dTMP kinase n=1 Tax=Streptomyces sp. NPDC012510 TaxID=3364838 RepID=UPI0036E03603